MLKIVQQPVKALRRQVRRRSSPRLTEYFSMAFNIRMAFINWSTEKVVNLIKRDSETNQGKNQAWYRSNQTSYPKESKLFNFYHLAWNAWLYPIFSGILLKEMKKSWGLFKRSRFKCICDECKIFCTYNGPEWNAKCLGVIGLYTFLLFLNAPGKTLTFNVWCTRIYIVSK